MDVILHVDKLALSFTFFLLIFPQDCLMIFILMKFLIAVFLPAFSFIPFSPFINFEDFCQPPRLFALSPFFILAEIFQPLRLFRPPLLFETREYS